jgi:hypothetical protein
MPWKIINGKSYYYRNVRKGGKVHSEYIGSGSVAERAYEIDRRVKRARDEDASAWRVEREAIEAADKIQAATFDAVEVMVRLTLELAGFHRHKRGEWRRRRMSGEIARRQVPGDTPAASDEIRELFIRVGNGDESELPRFRELFEAYPDRMLFATGAELAKKVEEAMIRKMAAGDPFLAEGLAWKMKALRRELAGRVSSSVEGLLADRVALCWLEVHDLDLRHSRAEGLTEAQDCHYQKIRDRAGRRYLAALKSLAQVRKLGVVNVQVNIDKQQVNIGDGGEPRPIPGETK